MDFWDLNKACPKDKFPLPNVDILVDAAVGHSSYEEERQLDKNLCGFSGSQ